MEPNITYTYKDCVRHDFEADVQFREELFSARLEKVFATSVRVQRVDVVITKNDSRTHVRIDLISPDVVPGVVQEEGFEPVKVVNGVIDTAIQLVHAAKDKHSHH